jgi:hypothetical protein
VQSAGSTSVIRTTFEHALRDSPEESVNTSKLPACTQYGLVIYCSTDSQRAHWDTSNEESNETLGQTELQFTSLRRPRIQLTKTLQYSSYSCGRERQHMPRVPMTNLSSYTSTPMQSHVSRCVRGRVSEVLCDTNVPGKTSWSENKRELIQPSLGCGLRLIKGLQRR